MIINLMTVKLILNKFVINKIDDNKNYEIHDKIDDN